MNDKSEINPAHKAYNCAEGNKLERDLAAASDEIDKTYKAWCGRDYMHLPLCEAVGKAMEASRAECAELHGKLYWATECTPIAWTGVVVKCENIDDNAEVCAVLNDLPAEWIGKHVAVSLVPSERGEGVKG